jgi:hypothetical protein
LGGKMLIYFMAIWNILRIFGIFYDHLVQFVFLWYILSGVGTVYQEKSGNPDDQSFSHFVCVVSSSCFSSFVAKKHKTFSEFINLTFDIRVENQ